MSNSVDLGTFSCVADEQTRPHVAHEDASSRSPTVQTRSAIPSATAGAVRWGKCRDRQPGRPYDLTSTTSLNSLPQFGHSNVCLVWSGLPGTVLMLASIMRVRQRGQGGRWIESEYGVAGLNFVTRSPRGTPTAFERGVELVKCTGVKAKARRDRPGLHFNTCCDFTSRSCRQRRRARTQRGPPKAR